MNMKRFRAFSLVELMVTLIVVSVLVAALVPVITKKLNSNAISLNTSDSSVSDITSECSNNPNFGEECKLCTQKFCIDCGLGDCASSQYKDTKRCECKSCTEKYSSLCAACDINGCQRCISAAYYINNGSCVACPSGSYCDGVDIYATCPGSGYYCDSTGIHKCSEKFSSNCSTCTSSGCTKCNSYYFISDGTCKSCVLNACTQCTSTSYCTKCASDWVLDTTQHKCTKTCATAMPGCLYCSSGTECTTCKGTHYLNTDKTCTECTLANCLTCLNGRDAASPACQRCDAGYFIDTNGGCTSCASKFGAQCTTCNANQCLSCIQGYHLKEVTASNACENDDNKFNCSDSNFMQVGNLCMTRKNMGDTDTLPIPSTVTVVEAGSGETCYSASEKCCWKGPTANPSGCDSENGGYSGCNRTVCNWSAAKEICSNFKYEGRVWRLPTKEEMANLPYVYSIKLGSNGLMLCDHSLGFSSARCAHGASRCSGSYDGNCIPYHVWSGSLSGTLYAYTYGLYSGSWVGPSADLLSYAFSVRCVSSDEAE